MFKELKRTNSVDTFYDLYYRMVKGRQYINRHMSSGHDTSKDQERFYKIVIEPLEEVWASLPQEFKDTFKQVKMIQISPKYAEKGDDAFDSGDNVIAPADMPNVRRLPKYEQTQER